jgi:isoleucyl-tRNA synthetase
MQILFETSSEAERDDITALSDLIKDELNVKEVSFADDLSGYASYRIKPRFDLLGKKMGARMKALAAAVTASGDRQAEEAAKGNPVSFMLEDGEVILEAGELIVETVQRPGWCAVSQKGRKAALSTEVNEELLLEGFLRELLNRIQNSRKDAGFQIEDRIRIMLKGGSMTEEALRKFECYIKEETLAEEISFGVSEAEYSKEWEVNDELVTIAISRVR